MTCSSCPKRSLSLLASILLALCVTGCADDAAIDTQPQDEDAAQDASDVVDASADFDAHSQPDIGADTRADAADAVDTANAPTWSGEVWPIFQTYGCSSGYCHGGGLGGLDWGTAETTYDDMVGVVSASDGGCSDLVRVAPSDSANSLLYRKLAGTQSCGVQMPSGAEITSAELETVRLWIEAGAKR